MGKKAKVVFDTNVWISIFLEKKLKDEFIQAKDDLTIYTSKDIALEISKVLLYPKITQILKKAGILKKDILKIYTANSKLVKPNMKLHIITGDKEDNKILECALAAKAHIIVSGDKHLLELGKYKKIKILKPKEFFKNNPKNQHTT